ncbi:hypothetical protein D3C87_1571250 [compost metagenome]
MSIGSQKSYLSFILLIEDQVFGIARGYFCSKIVQLNQRIVDCDNQTIITDPRLIESPIGLNRYIILEIFDRQ